MITWSITRKNKKVDLRIETSVSKGCPASMEGPEEPPEISFGDAMRVGGGRIKLTDKEWDDLYEALDNGSLDDQLKDQEK